MDGPGESQRRRPDEGRPARTGRGADRSLAACALLAGLCGTSLTIPSGACLAVEPSPALPTPTLPTAAPPTEGPHDIESAAGPALPTLQPPLLLPLPEPPRDATTPSDRLAPFNGPSLAAPPIPALQSPPIVDALPDRTRRLEARDPARATAVALNYCRASFHRIRRNPTPRVLAEEQEQILDNLDLDGVVDEDVLRLYGAVLDEIRHVRVAGQDRRIIDHRAKDAGRRAVVASLFETGLQTASGNYVDAVRAGAAGWWDVRTVGANRDLDLWKVERERITALLDKSTLFLDVFWKTTRTRSVPDRWLVRDDDLDRLEAARLEPDLAVRLRRLQRLEEFFECHPPHRYHVARTLQSLGRWDEAVGQYAALEDLALGFFRRDELLASGAANRALIEDHLQRPDAARAARRALACNGSAWEVRLACAEVLLRSGAVREAEDAALRNLDEGLEREQSLRWLARLHLREGDRRRLAERLARPDDVRLLPVPLLARCVDLLGAAGTPRAVWDHLHGSLWIVPDLRFGPDDFVVTADPAWNLADASLVLSVGDRNFDAPRTGHGPHGAEARFERVVDWGGPFAPLAVGPPLILVVRHPGAPAIRLTLRPAPAHGTAGIDPPIRRATATGIRPGGPPAPAATSLPANRFVAAHVEVEATRDRAGRPHDAEPLTTPPLVVPLPRPGS